MMKALHLIASYADRDLIIKTKKDPKIPLSYSCVHWKKIAKKISRNNQFKLTITNEAIVIED